MTRSAWLVLKTPFVEPLLSKRARFGILPATSDASMQCRMGMRPGIGIHGRTLRLAHSMVGQSRLKCKLKANQLSIGKDCPRRSLSMIMTLMRSTRCLLRISAWDCHLTCCREPGPSGGTDLNWAIFQVAGAGTGAEQGYARVPTLPGSTYASTVQSSASI